MANSEAPRVRRTRESIWRLVNARCTQLADAVAAARLPFLLLLTWSFVWMSGLYYYDYGYLSVYHERYANLSLVVKESELLESKISDEFSSPKINLQELCDRMLPKAGKVKVAGMEVEVGEKTRQGICKEIVKRRFEYAQKMQFDTPIVQFPGSIGKIHISDLGIVGNGAALLIGLWCFFAMRRENHAIKTFVDFAKPSRSRAVHYWTSFILQPQEPYFSSEHYAYGYHAVSQRFVFVLSSRSRPLLLTTVALACLPAIASLLNLHSDLSSVVNNIRLYESVIFFNIAIEIVLVFMVLVITSLMIWMVVETSVLLNGWALAVEDVWMDRWDERNDDPAPPVKITVQTQSAEPYWGSQRDMRRALRFRPRRHPR